jgi:hypothetical protein
MASNRPFVDGLSSFSACWTVNPVGRGQQRFSGVGFEQTGEVPAKKMPPGLADRTACENGLKNINGLSGFLL